MTVATALTTPGELQRLTSLLPLGLQHCVTLKRATAVSPPLIESKRSGRDFVIQLDLMRWPQLSLDQRDLLLWHEAAKIQNHTVYSDQREFTYLAIAGGATLAEIWTQNILLLSSVLVMAGLVGFQLYQKHQGESSLRAATKADQAAIALAVECGYTPSQATDSLKQALQMLIVQTPQQRLQKQYRTRLQALKILSA